MAIDFPSSPTVGQQYTFNGVTYTFTSQGTWVVASQSAATVVTPACGRLTYVSTTQLAFTPYNGDRIRINGVVMPIPSAGIAGLTNSGLSNSTRYYVYAYNNSGTITGEFSTTTHATSSTSGNVGTEIKSGDDTRTLVGMVFTDGSHQFSNTNDLKLVISWFNRRGIVSNYFGGNANTTSTTVVGLLPPIQFLNWGDEGVHVTWQGQGATSGAFALLEVLMDGSTDFGQYNYVYSSTPAPAVIGGWGVTAEGYHYYQIAAGAVSGSGTVNVTNAAIFGMTRG